MELVQLATVDSTSAHAAELVRLGKAVPFAVAAHKQTAGRGRRGHKWESPEGNLYVSFVVRPDCEVGELGLIPLKAAVVVGRVLERLAGLRLTLKWPNDLLFAGRKLGGLLCETSLRGSEPGETIIGLGLNLTAAPALVQAEGDVKYQAVSLHEILGGAPIDVAVFTRHFVHEFGVVWNELLLKDTTEAYRRYAIGPGQVWVELGDGGMLAGAEDLGSDGSLALQVLEAQRKVVLTSAEHRFAWIYQGSNAERFPLYLADVGNTRVKLAAYIAAAKGEGLQVSLPNDDLEERIGPWFKQWTPLRRGYPLFVLSVNPTAAHTLAETATKYGFHPINIPKRPLRVKGDAYPLSELGIDRLAAMEGYLVGLAPQDRRDDRVALVVSSGTATTIDALRCDGEHLGGYIIPGLALALRSLHAGTGLLPLIEVPEAGLRDESIGPAFALGKGTHSAMASGAISMAAGAVLATAHLAAAAGKLDEIVLTGGNGLRLVPALEQLFQGVTIRHDAGLVATGARAMVLGGIL